MTFRLRVADGPRVASSTRWSAPCCSSRCSTQHDGSALEKRGFSLPNTGSVLRSRSGSSYPFLSVRYIFPLSDSKSNANFILTGDITGSRTISDLSSPWTPISLSESALISRRSPHPASRLRAWVLPNRDCSTFLCVPRSWWVMQLT